jgi:hypothetical protein
MAKKDVGEMQRASGFQTQFWSHFTAAVVGMSGSADQLWDASDDQMREAARVAAQSFVVRQEPPAPNVSSFEITVSVDYGQSLDQHVRNGRASDYAKRNLTGRNFPRSAGLNGVVTNDYVVLNYGRVVSSDEVLADAARLGLHRPTPEETLTVGRVRSDLVLVGLVENPWLSPDGDRNVPVVVGGGASLRWLGGAWGAGYSFLSRK